ncbi:type VI secretion system lipoprotein TssJ [Chelatococcus sp. GCM10030263]|uniref:type VI secretion system lipoprotein TssJ n=1 Tax=Chelatococcus sp. GCM10030263 TaxID=3273387 RepID=UPI003622C77A
MPTLMGVLATVGACALLTPHAPAVLKATLVAGAVINPDGDGRPSPVVVHVFELASETEFAEAGFSALYEDADKTLGDALLARHSVILQPASTKMISINLAPRTSAIGAVAGLARFANVTWRALARTAPGKSVAIRIVADATGISIEADR